MKKYQLITNSIKDKDCGAAKLVAGKLKALCPEAELSITDMISERIEEEPDASAAIVLGGDGTMLKVAIALRRLTVPLLGVNLGNVGYLTEIELNDIDAALTSLVNEKYSVEMRMMLAGCTVIGGRRSELDHALNDIVLSRSGELLMAGYRVSVNGVFLSDFYADGIIISTPTGSTGYNLSAGGPIVEPSAKLMVLTCVAPHTLKSRSIVLSDEDDIRIELLPGRGNKEAAAGAYFDGVDMGCLKPGDFIEIRKSIRTCRIIKIGSDAFLQVTHSKLNR